MFDPPVSTPISRMMRIAASRMSWYSLSVSVCAGATVIESPVCTPIGSRFSIEQMITTLSAVSRITSSSNSFQPSTDCSISTSWLGDCSRPYATLARYSLSSRAIEPPVPPSVREGRMISGMPNSSSTRSASAIDLRDRRARHLEPDFDHRILEQVAILGLLDRVELRADKFALEAIEHARLRQLDRQVKRGLPADRRQQRVGPLALDNLGQHLDRHRFDIGAVGQFRIGHDRRRIRVDEDQPQPFLAQRLERLRARVVELAGLPDHDRPRANQQNRFQIFAKRQLDNPDEKNSSLCGGLGRDDPFQRFRAVARKRFDQLRNRANR